VHGRCIPLHRRKRQIRHSQRYSLATQLAQDAGKFIESKAYVNPLHRRSGYSTSLNAVCHQMLPVVLPSLVNVKYNIYPYPPILTLSHTPCPCPHESIGGNYRKGTLSNLMRVVVPGIIRVATYCMRHRLPCSISTVQNSPLKPLFNPPSPL
jgi:hypothetical protein